MTWLRRVKIHLLKAALGLVAVGAIGAFIVAPEMSAFLLHSGKNADAPLADSDSQGTADQPTVVINQEGLGQLKIGTVGLREFSRVIRDVGVVDFNQDASAAIFPSYQGKIVQALVDLGDHVEKDQILYTISSPDLVQAESTLLATAGVLDLATRNVGRLRQSVKNGGGAQKDLDQAQSDLQTAVGAYGAARQALAIFGKTTSETDRIASSRVIDPILAVRSPMTGTITARNAAPGMFVQPGTAPAPYGVADLGQVRLYDFVSEDESPAVRLGEPVTGHVAAYPDRVFTGTVSAIAAAIDPSTHRLQVETLIPDPAHLLHPSMFAELVIQTGAPVRSPAVPTNAVVRLGDGTMTVWAALEQGRFAQRVVTLGLQQDGFDQVVNGIRPGESIVTDGAVYVSNVANANAAP